MKINKLSLLITVLATSIASVSQIASAIEIDTDSAMDTTKDTMKSSKAELDIILKAHSSDATGESVSNEWKAFLAENGKGDVTIEKQQAEFEKNNPNSAAIREQVLLDTDTSNMSIDELTAQGNAGISSLNAFNPDDVMAQSIEESGERVKHIDANKTDGNIGEVMAAGRTMSRFIVSPADEGCVFLMCMIDPEWPKIPDCVPTVTKVSYEFLVNHKPPVCLPDIGGKLMDKVLEKVKASEGTDEYTGGSY